MTNPCIDFCAMRLGKQYSEGCNETCEYAKAVREKKELEESLNRKVENLNELVSFLCENMECENCPVVIHKHEIRSDYQKKVMQEHCCLNLKDWILKEAEKEKKDGNKTE